MRLPYRFTGGGRQAPAPRSMGAAVAAAIVASILLWPLVAQGEQSDGGAVTAAIETTAVPHSGDAADDVAVWIHPTDRSKSVVIGTDKLGGLAVYDLSGRQLHYYAHGRPNNVDIRYGFQVGGQRVAIVATSDRATDSIRLYRVDEATRGLVPIGARTISAGIGVYGLCMYRSTASGKYYVFDNDNGGTVQQWELFDAGGGKVDARKVRQFDVGATTEGCVADDELGRLYVSEEDVAIWRYGADPGAGTSRGKVDGVGSSGNLTDDIEGLSIYHASGGTGYLIASSQGSDEFVVYRRDGANAYVKTFAVETGMIDEVTHTDGIDVTNANLGGAFGEGMFVAQDGRNDSGNQNFKLIPWGAIARNGTTLTIDTSWDPPTGSSGSGHDVLHSTPSEPFVAPGGAPVKLHGFNVVPVWQNNPGETWDQSKYAQIRDKGFNAVRFVLHWNDFEPFRGSFNRTHLATLDTAIARAKAAGLYVVLDAIHLYGSGGLAYVPQWAKTGDSVTTVQTNGAGYLKLLATRYRNEPAVAAYDPVNEFYRWPIDQNGVLRAYDRLIREIRTVDPDKIVIVEPTFGDTSIAGNLADFANLTHRRNVVWSIHDYFAGGDDDGYAADGRKQGTYVFGGTTGYPSPNVQQLENHLRVHVDKMREVGLPIWIGEFGIGDGVANHDQWIRDKIAVFRKYGLGGSWWEYYTRGPMSAVDTSFAWKPWVGLIVPSSLAPPPDSDSDTVAPETTITGGPAEGSTVTSTSASLAFASSESGSTYECKLDAAAFAACSSPTEYSGLAAGTHTFSVRAKDAAGNVDQTPATRSWTVSSGSGGADPVIAAVGDIACDPATGSFNGGAGTSTACRHRYTADLTQSINPDAVLMLGDAQYEEGTLTNFSRSYDPTWGRFKSKTWAAAGGSHDFYGGGDFYRYFGTRAGPAPYSAYSVDIGSWHVISLPSGSSCSNSNVGGCGVGSKWHTWLKNDLAAHSNRCTLAFWHYPLWSSGYHGGYTVMKEFMRILYNANADLVLVAHDHNYERFAPQTPDGVRDDVRGIRQIVVGTGGKSLRPMSTTRPNSVVRNASTYGVLKLALRSEGYDFEFVPEPGRTFTDKGSATCH